MSSNNLVTLHSRKVCQMTYFSVLMWQKFAQRYNLSCLSLLPSSPKIPPLRHKTEYTMTSAKKCWSMHSRATMSASLLMARLELANPTRWWASRKKDKKESFPWCVKHNPKHPKNIQRLQIYPFACVLLLMWQGLCLMIISIVNSD